jgi:hypothetical protein
LLKDLFAKNKRDTPPFPPNRPEMTSRKDH